MSVRIMREAGREGLAAASLPTDAPMVWDGRFEIRTSREGLTVGPLAGSAKRLGRHDSMALRAAPPRARGTLPIISDGEHLFCPVLNPVEGVEITALAGARLFAACGLVEREPA
jgi:tRNA(Ile)-lysidine synthase